MKYLLIDGNNLACRCAFANEQLMSTKGIPSGVHFGVFQSLILLKKKFRDYQFLMVWDGKSARRVKEASAAVVVGIVPEGYKENRKKDPQPKPLQDFYAQSPFLQRGIGATGIPQIRLPEFEADDVIASYCKILKDGNEVICVTSDNDYRQLLSKNVKLWDGMKQRETTEKGLSTEYGIQSCQWIDVGAFMGDDGDNIFGVPGWGEKTAIKMIAKHGTWEKVISFLKQTYQKERDKFPDLKDVPQGDQKFKELSEMKSESDKIVYTEISFNMPFTGVLYEFAKGNVKGKKAEIMALMFQDRIKLAYSLKKMDYIESLPAIEPETFDKKKLMEYMDYYDIHSLYNDIDVFGGIYGNDTSNLDGSDIEEIEDAEAGTINSLGNP